MLKELLLRREVTGIINQLLDNWLPPVLRDARWFMWVPMKLFSGKSMTLFMQAKQRIHTMNPEEFSALYAEAGSVVQDRPTDLHKASIARIQKDILGENVLDAGCGRGKLAGLLAEQATVTGCDIYIPETLKAAFPNVTFESASIEKLPFQDAMFDTVVCTHTLEHVIDLHAAIQELRRVTKKRLIVVVPRQRSCKYTFDFHVHFFPYDYSLYYAFGSTKSSRLCELIGGDWYYIEDKPINDPGV